ncbi:MAG: beta-ketoacyl synthase N-terminal-like domain-containing protein [Pseudomonadota bacterium]|nr:beta-ketoacyl synthase N-terminal-like domain-containing protein [Pseudomonadota bacterium]
MLTHLAHFRNIGHWLEHWANHSPAKTAFHFLGESDQERSTISFKELQDQAQRIATCLLQTAAPGDRVILTYAPGLEFISAFLGCVQAGLIAVPVYPPSSPKDWPRFVKIVESCDANTVCTTEPLAQMARMGIAMTPQLANLSLITTDALNRNDAPYVECIADENATAFLQYTSGSTGHPKGVVLSHGNLHHNESLIREALHCDEDSVVVCWLPQYHDMGLIGNLLGCLFNGMTVVLMSPLSFLKSPYRWLQAISEFRGTHSGGPNFSYELCVKRITEAQLDTLDLSSWELAYNGAEPIRASTLERFANTFARCGFDAAAFTPLYGLAESTLMVTHHPRRAPLDLFAVDTPSLHSGKPRAAVDGGPSKTLVASGQVIGQSLKIVNPESMAPCAEQEVGEVWVQGDSVARGYWKNPDATAATFAACTTVAGDGPYLRTGDLGFLRDGMLYITGRLKEMMIVDGRNLYPQDIEETIQAVDPVFRIGCGAVFSLEDESVVAVQELSERYDASPERLAALARTALRNVNEQHQLALQELVLIEAGSLLKTSSGKIRRTTMAQLFREEKLKAVARFQPRDFFSTDPDATDNAVTLSCPHYEAILLQTLSRELGLAAEHLNPHTSFSDLGLDSKTLVGLAGILEQALGQTLAPQLFFDYPSIHKLASHLSLSGQDGQQPAAATAQGAAPLQQDIAIIGIGCRFPGQADSPEAFWQLLESGRDAISETPDCRWSNQEYYDPDILAPGKMTTKWGGYLHRVRDFDAAFFGIKEKEATLLDPQQRVLLETSWHALEHAGIPAHQTSGQSVGVFVGLSNVDYDRHCSQRGASSEPYVGTGNAASIAANRLSFFYDWRGPSVTVDTACSSSLVALHQACRSLQHQECDLAVAAGVNLILAPDLSITFSKSGMMAADGRCKTFDDRADGYVRSEGCGVLILKPLRQAQADGDHIIAVVKGSAITQDGRSNGITAPNGPAQVNTIERALRNAGVTAAEVQYVESHGTGTALGDPIELTALQQAYGQQQQRHALLVGSVKSNIGHLESAAGIAGVIKTALSLQRQLLPANLHFQTPNTRFDWERSAIRVVTRNQPWLAEVGTLRRAGVSSFGFGGTNAHVILEQAPPLPEGADQDNDDQVSEKQVIAPEAHAAQLFCLSARDRTALQAQIQNHLQYLPHTKQPIQALCANQNAGRTHFEERLAVKCHSVEQLHSSLRNLNWANLEENVFSSRRRRSQARPSVTWMFTGQGSQAAGMGRDMYHHSPVFRQTIDHCHDLLLQHTSIELRRFILADAADDSSQRIQHTDCAQPVLFCYEYALAQVLFSLGIEPDNLIGHSLGEIVAATVAGVFSLEDGIRLAGERGRLMQSLDVSGGMMAVFAHPEDVQPLLQAFPLVSIGARNGPGQVVLSGCVDSLHRLCELLGEQDIDTRMLEVSHGFHSPLMAPMLEPFRDFLHTIPMHRPRYRLISNVTAAQAEAELTTAEYWCRHVTATVDFHGGLQQIASTGTGTDNPGNAILIELGPKPILSAIAQRSLDRDNVRIVSLIKAPPVAAPLIQSDAAEYDSLLDGIAQCYTSGLDIRWDQWMTPHPRTTQSLPLYPFQRKYFWLSGVGMQPVAAVDTTNAQAFHPLLGKRQRSPYLKNGELHFIAYPGLDAAHWACTFKQTETIHFHLSHFLEMAIEVGNEVFGTSKLTVQDLELHKRMHLERGDHRSIHTIAEARAHNELRVHFYTAEEEDSQSSNQWVLLCSASLTPSIKGRSQVARQEATATAETGTASSQMSSFFADNKSARTVYCTNDKNVVCSTRLQENQLSCAVDFSELMANSSARLWIKPEVAQGLYQVVGFFCESLRHNDAVRPGVEYTPYSARSVSWTEHLPAIGSVEITHVGSWSEDAEHTELDLAVFDDDGHCTLRIEGLLMRSRLRSIQTLSERVRQVSMDERVSIIGTLVADSLASSLGGQAMDIDLSRSLAELGVDSIAVLTTLSRLKQELDLDIKAGEINRARSIEDFITILAAKLTPNTTTLETGTTLQGCCAVMRQGLPGVLPLIFIHPGNEGALQYLDLANAFGEDVPLYVMLPEMRDGHQPRSLDRVVEHLVSDIRTQQPHGPYLLAGWSLGATLALLVANQLSQAGEEIKFVSVIDAPCILGSGISAQSLQYCIEQLSVHQNIMCSERLLRYKAELFDLYAQALKSKLAPLGYELRHFQTGPTHGNLVANSTAAEWSRLTNRKLHSKTIPGDHLSLFKSGNVETLASFLRQLVRNTSGTRNRFLQSALDRALLTQSLLLGAPTRNERNHPCGTLHLDEEHPYFFDHVLDHIPGTLIMAGAWELICRSTLECDPLNPLLSRQVGQCSLQFNRFAEKHLPLHFEVEAKGGDAHSVELECIVTQSTQRIGTLYLTLQYRQRKPALMLPAQRDILRGSHDLLHKHMESNVLISQPEQSDTRWQCRPQMPEAGHYLSHTTLAYGSLNPIYVLEATRQFLTYLSHEQYGVALGTHVNLIDISLLFKDAIEFNADVQMVLTPQADIVEQDTFQTITVLWQQNGRTVVSSQITAQVTRLETYTQQRAR